MASLSHSKISYLNSSDNGKEFWLLCSLFLFFLFLYFHWKCICSHVDLNLRRREVSRKKMQTHIMNWKGKSVLGDGPTLLNFASFASFYGENRGSHNCGNLWNGAEISILQVLGQCPRLDDYSSSLQVLDADSSGCKLWPCCLHLCSIFSEKIILFCPQSVFLQQSTRPLRSGLNPSINLSKDHQKSWAGDTF